MRKIIPAPKIGIVLVAGILLFILGGIGFGTPLGAGNAAHFLRFGVGARAMGMGGAFVAVADDVNAAYWNPAGLIQSASVCVGGTYESRFNGLVEGQSIAGTLSSGTREPVAQTSLYCIIRRRLQIGEGEEWHITFLIVIVSRCISCRYRYVTGFRKVI